MINFPFSTCFQRMENERCVHFVSSCELLVARYLFGACFALLYSFCFGAVAGLVTKCCECREGSSGMNSCVLVLNLSLTPSGFSCEQFFCIPFCCVPSFLSVFLGTLCVSLPHTFVARLSCATLFHARSLHFLKMQGGFRFQSSQVFASDGWRTTLSHSCRVGTLLVMCHLVWVFCCSVRRSLYRIVNPSTLTDNQHWYRSWSLRTGPREPASLWEKPPVWNGKAETWNDWEREETLWTLSIQAPTLGPRLVRTLHHLPSVCDVGPLASKGGAREEHWCRYGFARKVPPDIATKLREMPGPSMMRKAGSEGFAAYEEERMFVPSAVSVPLKPFVSL